MRLLTTCTIWSVVVRTIYHKYVVVANLWHAIMHTISQLVHDESIKHDRIGRLSHSAVCVIALKSFVGNVINYFEALQGYSHECDSYSISQCWN